MFHVTAGLLLPVTVAVNCWVWETVRVAAAGETVTATGLSVTVALADLLVSAALVAVAVTVGVAAIEAGAVYRPAAEIVPTLGLMVHVTAALLPPVTVAVNCWVWETVRVAAAGETVTATGLSATVALADLLVSATPGG